MTPHDYAEEINLHNYAVRIYEKDNMLYDAMGWLPAVLSYCVVICCSIALLRAEAMQIMNLYGAPRPRMHVQLYMYIYNYACLWNFIIIIIIDVEWLLCCSRV